MDPNYTLDALIWPQMVKLHACLKEQLGIANLDNTCAVYIFPGEVVDLSADSDIAWVRLVTAFPTDTFPVQSQVRTTTKTIQAAVIELGISRCIKTSADGGPLTEDENFAAARLELADMAVMRKAVKCCKFDDASLGAYIPWGPEGSITGGVMEVTIAQSMGG